PDGSSENTVQTFYEGQIPNCIENKEYLFDHYCDQGNWSSRTKFLAGSLVEVAEDTDYILYCTPYQNALPFFRDDHQLILGGENLVPADTDCSLDDFDCLERTDQENVYTFLASVDENLISQQENTRINNVCILKYKKSGAWKTALATTLNLPINNEDSFLNALFEPQISLDVITSGELCEEAENGFVKCDLDSLGRPGEDLWYSPELNAIVYGKGGLNVRTVWGTIVDFFSNLFGGESELSDEHNFVNEAQNFRELYLYITEDKTVHALMEIFPNNQTLIAEYEGFQTPLCEYVQSNRLAIPEFQLELLEEAEGRAKLACTDQNETQRIEAVGSREGLQFLWPQLTGKLRVS
ncbi:MAG: hypothetical protein KJ597_06115, partial [Nanoarchaeota archaeon]|nr:hypothetical protein [Nanoarchaeota archaeon]